MTIGMRNRRALRKPYVPQPTPIQRRLSGDPKREIDRLIGGCVIGFLTALIIIGLIVDAFVRPAYWLIGNP